MRVTKAGYNSEEIIEIVVLVAKSIFANYFNHIAGTAIDFPAAPRLKEGYSVIPNRSELIDENRLHFGGAEYVDPLMIVKPMKVTAAGNDQIKFVC
jgi:hypothetical protein